MTNSKPTRYDFPSCRAILRSMKHTLTGNIQHDIRLARDTPALRTTIEQNNHRHHHTWDTIQWDIHSHALKRLPRHKQHQALKFIHGWLPTFSRLHKFNQHPTQICPRCNMATETNKHFLQCYWTTDDTFRNSQINKLKCSFNKKDQPNTTNIQSIIINSIQAWMTNAIETDYTELLDDPNPYMHAAAATQEIIGWDNFLKARFSHAWTNCYVFQLNTTHQLAKTWLARLANWTQDLFFAAWKARNQLIFGEHSEKQSDVQRTRLDANIREIYAACNQLNDTAKAHHQFCPLDDLLKAPTSTLTIWLTQAKQTLTEHCKAITKGFPQTLITWYFASRQPQPVPITR